MARMSTVSRISVKLKGRSVPGAQDRQGKIPGFDQGIFSKSKVLCIGAGGLISHIAPALARKGIGALALLDDDIVETTNLNRQRFYLKDLGRNKAEALAENLLSECIFATELIGYELRFEDAVERKFDLSCDVAVCGVDNNPARTAASRYFRHKGIPVIFSAVSADGGHGYVFVQDKTGSCFGCLFPDAINDDTFPCPATPAITDILQAVGALAVYAVDTCLMQRSRSWNYRRLCLGDGRLDSSQQLYVRESCTAVFRH